MTRHHRDFDLNHPGALIAAIPAVLGFTPQNSLVLVAVDGGEMGAVLRVDLSEELLADLGGGVDHLVEVAAAARPEGVIAIIVDADGAACPMCNEQHRQLCDRLGAALMEHGIELWAGHIVDDVGAGGRWHCVDGCGSSGRVDDPMASPITAAAIFEGRRLYATRAELEAVVTVELTADADALADLVEQLLADDGPRRHADPDGCARRDVRAALDAAARIADGDALADAEIAVLGAALTDLRVRDTLYALAVGDRAGAAESLWAVLARKLPEPWRVEPLVLLAFHAYARGDGPLAGVSLDAALSCAPGHRMAGMLDNALQSGMRPEQIRQLALTGYRLADELGLRLPPRQPFGRRAG
jgi:Domain of unknown function (DUF4192)